MDPYGDPQDVESYGWYHLRKPGLPSFADDYGVTAHLLYAYNGKSMWKSVPIKGRSFGPFATGPKVTLCGLEPKGWHIARTRLGKKWKCKKCMRVMEKWIYGGAMR